MFATSSTSEGRVALVTGAATGIGRATALTLARDGAQIVIADIDEQGGQAAVDEILALGRRAIFSRTDVTDDASVADTVARADREFGRLDVLHNCAGGSVAADGVVTSLDLAVWDHTIALDLKGTFLMCRHAIPAIVRSGGGSVVNMTSWRGVMGSTGRDVYSTAKGGVISLTRALAAQFAADNVRVNAVAPGAIRTERALRKNRGGLGDDAVAEARARMAHRYPFSVGDTQDIANIVAFLASPLSRMITGAVIPADGGRSAYL